MGGGISVSRKHALLRHALGGKGVDKYYTSSKSEVINKHRRV